ncbi:MAG: TonB-dependent receptor [Ferruginibacter sp.]
MKVKKALLLFLCFFGLGISQVLAQTIQVSGKVISKATNGPLEGTTVSVKGSTTATTTDKDGNYSIAAPSKGAVLVFSFAGMVSEEKTVKNAGTVNITLAQNSNSLEEVVVIGYGTQKKSVLTGSISSVKAGDLNDQPITRVEQFLQGRASGLTIAQSSGQPGSSSTLRIRGTTSLTYSDPLYVVDGIPVDIGGIDYLNPSDIESIEVLKDAASAAIYGTRAASGVIIVTTKKGKNGRIAFNYNGYFGSQSPDRRLDLLNATQYATLQNEASVASGGPVKFDNISQYGKGTDWQKEIFNNHAKISNQEFSLSGGDERSTFYTSFGLFDQEGIVATPISKYKRMNIRLNATHKANQWLNVGTNLGYSHIKSSGLGNTNSEYGGPLSSAINMDPITPTIITDPSIINAPNSIYLPNPDNSQGAGIVRDANGNPYAVSKIVAQEMSNPLAYIKTHLGNYGWSDNFVGNAYVEIEPIKGLKVRSNLGAKYAFYGSESFSPLAYLNATSITKNNSFYSESDRSMNYTWENTISYTRTIKAIHHVTALVGTGAYVDNYISRNSGVTYKNLTVNNFEEAKSLNFSITPDNVQAFANQNTIHKVSSVYGRLIYDYGEKYLFQGIIRRDGSSRFGSNNKYGYFPSGSIGWVASKEDFFPKTKYVNFLKIRGSYGKTGSDNIGDFKYVSTVGGNQNYTFGTNDIYIIGDGPSGLANPDLQWEETTQTDIGFDATILKNINVAFDWYNKKTTGILQTVVVPLYVGVGGYTGNVADMTNKGYEIELGYHKTIAGVKFGITGNYSHLKNRVTYLGEGIESLGGGAALQSTTYPLTQIAVGHAIGSFYGFEKLGIFQTQAEINSYVDKDGGIIQPNARPGDVKWADLNSDGVIDQKDRTFIGDPTPDYSYGITITAAYKGFDLTVFGQGAGGNDIYNGLRRLDIANANWTTKALSRWTGAGTSYDFPRLTNDDPNHNFSNPSSLYLEKGDYFRIKVVQLGYTIPNRLSEKVHVQKLRIYVSGNNLATLTKYSGFDPEIGGSSYGIDRGIYPQARSWTAGLNLTF